MAGSEVIADLYPHSNVGTATHFHNTVTKSVVPGDHISSVFTCDCMMAFMMECTNSLYIMMTFKNHTLSFIHGQKQWNLRI